MKIFAISDLHLSTAVDKPMNIFGAAWEDYFSKIKANWQAKVSDEDIVLLSGDLSWAMTMEDALADINQLVPLSGKKVLLRGNHDYWWKSISQIRQALPKDFYAIQNDCLRIGEFLICGTRGWTCPDGSNQSEEDKKIYAREVQRLQLSLSNLAAKRLDGDISVCMMHYPPFNVRREHSEMTKLISEYKIDSVVYGHLHGKDCRADKVVNLNGIKYYLTSCDLIDNMPVQIY